jgi:phage terminase Nu1 subunit (DNA packaging protein)
MAEPKTRDLSIDEFARALGVTGAAVRLAIKTGRLEGHLERNKLGRLRVKDLGPAKEAWTKNSRTEFHSAALKERNAAREAREAAEGVVPNGTTDVGDSMSLSEQAVREKFWKAGLAELDFKERNGELVDAKEVEDKVADAFVRCRTKLLGVPSRAKLQLPHLSVADVAALDALVRESLEELVIAEEDDSEAEDA